MEKGQEDRPSHSFYTGRKSTWFLGHHTISYESFVGDDISPGESAQLNSLRGKGDSNFPLSPP